MSEQTNFNRKREVSSEKEISDTKKLKSEAETYYKRQELDNFVKSFLW